MRILEVCLTQQRLKEIMDALGHKHRPTFMNNYLGPLIQEGLIDLTLPDTPRDPRQMYRTTEQGRKMLEGKGFRDSNS